VTESAAPTTAAVRVLVRKVLTICECPGRTELLAQVDGIEYIDGPVTMMRLHVPRSYPPAAGVPSPVPDASPTVLNDHGEPIGGLIIWLDNDGYIDLLEYWWVTDDMPTTLPALDQIERT